MSTLVKNKITDLDIKNVYLNSGIDWEEFRNKTFYITGATGVIGSFIIRCLRHANKHSELNIKIIAAVRNIEKVEKFFDRKGKKNFEFYKSDVMNKINYKGNVDYIIHCANNTSSKSFIENPVETFNVAVKGTENILNFAKEKNVESVVYLSSMEVYGNIDQPKPLKETDLGNLDLTDTRSSYPMGKRAAETLCYNYAKEYNVPVKVVRLAQVIGSNVDYDDTRVYAQFARSIVEKKDIILNTKAATKRSYLYITDAVTGILTILTKGKNGEAYNNNNNKDFPSISEIAQGLSNKYTSTKVVFNLDNQNPYAPETHWILDNSKLISLGWEPKVSLEEAYNKLISSFYYQKYKTTENKLHLKVKNERNYYQDTLAEQLFSIKNKGNFKIIKIAGMKIANINLEKKYLRQYGNIPIINNKIVFANFKGNGYGCNPKYIAEEILKRNLQYELIWLVNKNIDTSDMPKNIKCIDFKSKEAMKELSTAKFWIDNQRKIYHVARGLSKRDTQVYIQTWHGSLGIKKLGTASPATPFNTPWMDLANKDADMINIILSNSNFDNKVFNDNLFDCNKIIMTGHPRNDIFFFDDEQKNMLRKKVCTKLNINSNKKILCYAPSFRENRNLDCYCIDTDNLTKILSEKFGNDWIIAIRMHPNVKNESSLLFNFNNNIVDASLYTDIQELLISSDIVISDYSSCIYDFMLSRKPAFIFATDIEQFNTERGFYYPLESTPFPVATDNVELMENIRNFDYEKYKQEVETFLQEKGCMEDGHASERVVDLIERIIKE